PVSIPRLRCGKGKKSDTGSHIPDNLLHYRPKLLDLYRFRTRHVVRDRRDESQHTGGHSMTLRTSFRQVIVFAWCLLAGPLTAYAQVTTGSIGGTVKDAQGGVIPGATVILISETQNTRSTPVVTNETGDFVFVNVKSDTYMLEVTMDAFKTV